MTEMTDRAETRPQRFRPYPEYRDSGVDWLGDIPERWEVMRLSWLTKCLDGNRIPLNSEERGRMQGDYPYYGANSILDYVDQWLFDEELVLLGEDGAPFFDRSRPVAFRVTGKIWVNNHAHVLRPQATIDAEFLAYALNSVDYRAFIDGSTRDKLTQGDMRGIPIQCPGMKEQRAIADFLDRETAEIDSLIAKKERLIELLQEKRTALITRAVTRGLDPNVPMKDSGVEWLGEIPAHWETLALGLVTISRCDGPFGSGLKSEHYSESGIRVVRLQNIGWAEFIDLDAAYLDEAYARRLGDHSVKGEDILVAGLGDNGHPVGRACVAPVEIEPAMVKADCFRFRLDRQQILPRYAAFQLSATASAVAGCHATGATRTRMNLTTSASRKIALPPLREQGAIAVFLDRETAKIDALVAKVRKAIDHLGEFRAALISAAVTGTIDVRAASADPTAPGQGATT